ncbi:hypothetical protein F5B22DRAFT_154481 [Xylaria bambusicola]|uniref:uncharacterized protein n=1 Tax=Xylaria bambusicola TaxID=326684 RepID=UPI0020078CB2|nr:uncharacterized protein F5B22DRAFT_154481 [Xylaria bambusicola]KAI0526354.1 hypothetical protein F5B22DRAFT_154481 [Xylaria bambusicola]
MSSSSSSSSSHSQRTPLYERTDSEKNKLQIRLVPYTPPKITAEETASHAPEPETPRSNIAFQKTNDRTSNASTSYGRERFIGSALSSPASSSSPIVSSTWVKGKGVSESRFGSDSPGTEHPAPPPPAVLRTSHSSFIRRVNAPTQQSQGQRDNGQASSPTTAKAAPRRERVISVNSDKTFSLLKSNTRVSTGSESTARSYLNSNTSFFSSHEETSFDAPTDDHPSSLFSSLPERSVSPSSSAAAATPTKPNEDNYTSSPWNYRMIGGLRKVPITPEPKAKGKEKEPVTKLPALQETTNAPCVPYIPLTQKSSFVTELSDSTSEETTNYQIIGRSSPPLPDSDSIDVPPSSSSSNYQLLGGQSSTHQSINSSPARGHAVLDTPGSKNYIVHGNSYPASEQISLDTPGSRNFIVHDNITPSPSVYSDTRGPREQTSFDSFRRQVKETYSQESLVIPPLRPHKRSSSENLYLKRASKENAHGRANSFSSISSVLTQDSGPNVVRLGYTPPSTSSVRKALWTGRNSSGLPKLRMDKHQWSSQLSTVMSEYEGSDRGSRLTSHGSAGERGSSALGSRGSRNIQSISSSIFDNLETTQVIPQTHSRSGSLDRPGAAFMRGARELPSPPAPTVRDHDEHGDGLADLQHMHQLQSKSSRTRLGFLSRQSSDRSLRSSTSSRSGSLTSNSLPTWARLYYGSGERRWLASPSIISEGDDNRPPSSWVPGGSPAPEQFHQDIRNPRRRPREPSNDGPQPILVDTTTPVFGNIRRGLKKKTSSIWSPHLRPDNRFSRYSIWQPPSDTWSTENRILGRRNIQVVLFVFGFIFPFAWMIAGLLPLPPNPRLDMEEVGTSTTQLQPPNEFGRGPVYSRVALADETSYQSARWWRHLNRYMSIFGILILGAIVALVVVGVKQGWGK